MGRKKSVPRIVVITGGKGGVGKSTIAANLALAMGRLGQRVTLVDADLGAANLHTMLGVVRPAVGLADFFDEKIKLEEACVGVGIPTVALIPGTSRPGAANLSAIDKARLLRGLARLDTDVIVVDVGAGTSFNVVDLVAVADIKLFVLTRWITNGTLDHIPKTAFDGCPKLLRLQQAVAEHPGVKAWYAR